DRVDQRRVPLTIWFRELLDQRLIALAQEGGEILAVPDERAERVSRAGETRSHLLQRGSGRGLAGPLRDLQRLMAKLRRGSDGFACDPREVSNVTVESFHDRLV